MVGVRDTRRPTKGLSVLIAATMTAVSLIGGLCWTLLVGAVGYFLGMFAILSAGGVVGDPELAQSYLNQGEAIWVGAAALALAPWLVVGFLVATI
jgi:hypothetical protein